MKDINGNTLQVGDKVRFFGSGGGACVYEKDPIKRLRAYGVIVNIVIAGDQEVAQISVGGSKDVWNRLGEDILKR